MHLVFQFPIVDSRALLENENGKLPYPEWPDVGTNAKRFIRHFGSVQQRKSGGSDDWPGEGFFCDSHLSMRYDKLHEKGFEFSPGHRAAIFNSYRRYSSGEKFLGRVEAGFVDNIEKLTRTSGLNAGSIDIEEILRHYADLPVAINGKETKLFRAGSGLANSYYLKSTSNKVKPTEKQKWVTAGEVAVILVFTAYDQFKLPDYSFQVEEFELPGTEAKLKLHGCRFRHGDAMLKVWLIEMPVLPGELSKEIKQTLRNLRINLLRIHLEKETVRILLNAIKSKLIQIQEGSEQAELLNSYFEEADKKIFQAKRFSFPQKNLLGFALQSEDAAAPGSFLDLEAAIQIFKTRYIRKFVDRVLSAMEKKMILFICASPKEMNPLDFGEEFSKIQNAKRASADRDNYDLEIEPSVKKTEFLNILNRYKPDYLHISMHSDLTEGLYFKDDDGEVLPMPVPEFADKIKLFFEAHKKPQVIILSACNSKAHAESVKGYCKNAMGTQAPFPADAGVLYANAFYTTLLEKNSSNIPYCHENGNKAIQYATQKFGSSNNIPAHEIMVLIT
jgi:hypothetical protein